MRLRRRAIALVASLTLLVPALGIAQPATRAAAAAGPGAIVPAPQRWTPTAGTYTFRTTSRIVVNILAAAQLAGTAHTLATDIAASRAVRTRVTIGTAATARDGDLYLTLGATDPQLGAEGYRMDIAGRLTISARTTTGTFYGTRTFLQLLHQGDTITGGTVRDWPRYRERGQSVDNGRKYFSMPWLVGQIRELAYLKMNVLHLHISDNLGFRLESATHPEITTSPYYSKREIRALLAVAATYHVRIIPEIDMPGHMDAILAHHPELQLSSPAGTLAGKIDLSKDAVYPFVRDIVNEYLGLFPDAVWHLGADEYLGAAGYASYPQLQRYAVAHYGAGATGPDTFLGFINYVDRLVRARGHVLRIWNDGLWGGHNVTVNPDIDVEHWTHSGAGPAQLVAGHHRVVNTSGHYLYYVLGSDWKPDPASMYATFHPGLFAGDQIIPDGDPHLLGAMLAIWCDTPQAETETTVANGVSPAQRVLAQIDWGSPRPAASYDGFAALAAAAGHAPGYGQDVVATPGDHIRAGTLEYPADGAS